MTRSLEPKGGSSRRWGRSGLAHAFANVAILASLTFGGWVAAQEAPSGGLDARKVQSTILRGTPPPRPPPPNPVRVLPSGDINLDFPGVDVQIVAKAILGDTLKVPFAIDSNVHGNVTVVTGHPIRRADVLGVFEQALTSANFVLANRAGAFTILPAAVARGEAPVVDSTQFGYGNETITLKFVNAEAIRKLLDPLVPNAISVSDPVHNVLVVSGTSAQRTSLRELVAQFDVDWLRGMSFALLVPQRTDSRLIVPELEKLLNAPGSPMAGLVRIIAMDRLNGILAISSQAQYLDDVRRFVEILDREGEGAQRQLFVYHVQNGRASDLAKVLNTAFGNSTSSGPLTDSNSTNIIDHSSSSSGVTIGPGLAVPALLAGNLAAGSLGAGEAVAANRLAQAANQISSSGVTAPGPGAGATDISVVASITPDEVNNDLVVFSTPRTYALIEEALRKLDVLPLQVLIEASISEVTLNHDLEYGIQWYFKSGNNSAALTQGQGTPPYIPQQVFPAFSYMYASANITATLNALAKITDVTVLSAPKLMVLNNHTATIEVGDQVPISTGSAVSTVGTNAPIVNSIEYRDTGVILKVTPRVNTSGLVLLDIGQEVSDVTPNVTSKIDSPTITQRKISTSVAVQDGETIALGGLIKNEVTKGRSTVPLLGSIPVLGHLFGDTTGKLLRTELVVLLTPHVVRTPVDARAITEELKAKLHLAPPPPPPEPPKPPPPPRHPHVN